MRTAWFIALLVMLKEARSARRDAHIWFLKLQVEMPRSRLPDNPANRGPVGTMATEDGRRHSFDKAFLLRMQANGSGLGSRTGVPAGADRLSHRPIPELSAR